MRIRGIFPVLTLCVALAGCIHKTGGAVTPWERVTTQNEIFAQSLTTVAQGVVVAQQTNLITAQQAKPVLQFASQVASIQEDLNKILALAPSASNIPAIQALVNQVAVSAQGLLSSGALGVKNPKSQQTIGADVQAIVSSLNVILSSYQAATGGN